MSTTTDGAVRHTFESDTAVQIDAQLRASSLNLTAGPVESITVEVTPASGAGAADAGDVVVERSGNLLHIEVPEAEESALRLGLLQIGSQTSHRYSIHVQVPDGSSLRARAGSGSVIAEGPLEVVRTSCGSGRITVQQAGQMHAKAGSGDITVQQAGRLEAAAGSGEISVAVVEEAKLTAGSGNMRLGEAGKLELKTGSGDIAIDQLHGELRAKTGSGNITVQRAVAGSVAATAASGAITLGIPAGTAVLQDCSTVAGRLSSSLEQAEGPGDAAHRLELRARTVSGDISLHRAG